MSLEGITRSLQARLHEFAPLRACVRFDFGDAGALVVDARAAPPAFANGEAEVDCTIRLTVENAEKLLAGALNPTLAYATGRLKVQGSMGVAMKVAALLED